MCVSFSQFSQATVLDWRRALQRVAFKQILQSRAAVVTWDCPAIAAREAARNQDAYRADRLGVVIFRMATKS